MLVLLVALGAGAWWVLWRSDWLLVEDVVVTGAEERWHAQILDAAAIGLSQPMVEVDTGSAEVGALEVPIVREVSVTRSWPTTMTIAVTPREPVLAARQGGRYDLVDAEGARIETVPEALRTCRSCDPRTDGATPRRIRSPMRSCPHCRR